VPTPWPQAAQHGQLNPIGAAVAAHQRRLPAGGGQGGDDDQLGQPVTFAAGSAGFPGAWRRQLVQGGIGAHPDGHGHARGQLAQRPARRAPASMPVIVRGPVWARNPVVSAHKVWKVGAVRVHSRPDLRPHVRMQRHGCAVEAPVNRRVAVAFDELALAV
jgi:hypothetical protein